MYSSKVAAKPLSAIVTSLPFDAGDICVCTGAVSCMVKHPHSMNEHAHATIT